MNKFKELDNVSFDEMKRELTTGNRQLSVPFVSFTVDGDLWIQSVTYVSGIPKFSLKICPSQSFVAYRMGIECTVETLSTNRITKLDRWSRIEVAIRYLINKETSRQENVLREQIESMAPRKVGERTYGPDILIRAYAYYSISRSLYGKLRRDYKLPGETTLSNLTAKVNNISDKKFISEVFSKIEARQKECVVIIDEVYIKKALQYHGGKIYGKATNKPGELATSVLGIMVKCLFGGPTFLFKMVPVTKLDAKFLFDQVSDTLKLIRQVEGNPVAVICDGNRTNQAFFKLFKTVEGKPWLTVDGMFLLFDFVHLVKNIRNNWLTEQSGELNFKDKDQSFTAKGEDLLSLYNLEKEGKTSEESGVHGLSKLNELAVKPKPIERQRVNTCLRVFCEETHAALCSHPGMKTRDVYGTALFVKKVVDMWKILNVKTTGKDIRHNNPLEAVIKSPDDPRLNYLLEMGEMFKGMKKPEGGKRNKCLTKDTGTALHHTLNGIVELTKLQLNTTHDYVALTTLNGDPIEKEYCKFREGMGGAYFITDQNCMEKLAIKQTKLLLKLNVDVFNLPVDSGHHCTKCGYLMDEKASLTFDSLEHLEDGISDDTKMSLCHIAGYVTRHDAERSEEELLEITTFYHQKYGDFTDALDRGGLNIPSDTACQWTFFCYIMFNAVKNDVCRTSLSNLFMLTSQMHNFNMQRNHALILSNVFFKNHCVKNTPRSTKETKQKVIKLSVEC